MRYLTYDEYVDMGGTLALPQFSRAIDRACGIVRAETHSRIEEMQAVPQSVKALCRDLVDYIDSVKIIGGLQKVSESQSAGSVSESVTYALKTRQEYAVDIAGLVEDYLLTETDDKGVCLLYRGAK